MKLKVIKSITILVVIIAGVNIGLLAQEKNDAIKAFNESVELMKADPVSSIGSFENCIIICEQVGDSAEDIRQKAIQVLPGLYYQKSYDLLTNEKKVNESLIAARQTMSVAEKYNNTKVKENTQKLMVQAYTSIASGYFTANENEKALQAFDSVLMINPDHTASIYNKALTYKKMNNPAKFGETMDLYIGKLKATGDTVKIAQANKAALDYFRSTGAKSNQANKLADALTLFNTASKYGTDKDLYYQYANLYNKQKKFTDASANAQKGLDLETGTPEAKAKFYYELAVAQAGKGDTNSACESFKNSLYGPFLEASKAQRTNLKCK
jgi:tetratricopeptide (TPR) repeat protein